MQIRLLTVLTILGILCACVPSRPQAASVSSAIAPPQQAWWHSAVFYEIFVRSFYDTNGDGIGDFNGVTAKLDYLKDLGINAIWLMPIYPSPSYHGYDVTDYYSVNPQYGTMDDFKHLLAEAHKRGIRVILDLVLNHTSNLHPFFTDALHGPQSKYYDWYLWSDTNQGSYWHPITTGVGQKYFFGIFCDCMPDLNYNNPQVTAEMENVVKFWLNNIGVDGFRLDAANRLIEDGTKTENTPATHDWLKGFYISYKADNSGAYAIGEVYGADASLAKTYTGNQLDEVFNFEIATGIINSVNGSTNIGINSALTFANQTLPDGSYATFLTNHDQDRIMSTLNGSTDKAKVAAALLLTSPGTPYIYYGEEIGMQGEKPDEDIRLPMQWSSGANAGFSGATPWRAPFTNYNTVNVEAELSDPKSLLMLYKNLLELRKQHAALQGSNIVLPLISDPGIFASLRLTNNEKILVLVNLTNKAIGDYSISLSASSISSGKYQLTSLYGSDAAASLTVTSQGGFASLKPLSEIPAYAINIYQLVP
jgi:glycosidase